MRKIVMLSVTAFVLMSGISGAQTIKPAPVSTETGLVRGIRIIIDGN